MTSFLVFPLFSKLRSQYSHIVSFEGYMGTLIKIHFLGAGGHSRSALLLNKWSQRSFELQVSCMREGQKERLVGNVI